MSLSLSVVIPTYNAAPTVQKLLISLENSRQIPTEIIVVDDCSTDATPELLAAYPSVDTVRLTENKGAAHARNVGVQQASGDIILFLDADVIVQADTVGQVASFFDKNPRRHLMIGVYDSQPANAGLLPLYKGLQCLSYYRHLPPISTTTVFWTGVAAIRRSVFLELGGFDSHFFRGAGLEDVAFGRQALAAGYPIYLNRQVVVQHHFPPSLLKNFRDHYQRGFQWSQIYFRLGRLFDDYVTTRRLAGARLAACGSFLCAGLAVIVPQAVWLAAFFVLLYGILNYRLLSIFWEKHPARLVLLVGIDIILALALGAASLKALIWYAGHAISRRVSDRP